jgi:predicted RNA-binding Zn-ribbon protein involved in translation (DUF1610 family)
LGLLEGLREIIRGIERRRLWAPKYCPKCGSSKISLSSSFDIWLTPEQYVCKSCKYSGPIVLEIEFEE